MTNNTDEAEELLQEAKQQRRHTSEAQAPDADQVDRVAAIKRSLIAVEQGDLPENINIRDERLKALVVGLEEADELEAVAQSINEILASDVDLDTTDVTQSDITRLLIRVGLQEAVPDLLDDATEARKQAALEQADDF